MTAQKISAAEFLRAFSDEWRKTYRDPHKKKIDELYGSSPGWTRFLLSSFQDLPIPIGEPEWDGLFARTARRLKSNFPIKAIRREDYKIDMMVVGGEALQPWSKGDPHWGYATRCMVMIEHENDMEACHEELYNLLVRRGELKVLAFPQWRKDADWVGTRGGGNQRTAVDALDQTLRILRGVEEGMRADENVPGENDNLLLLVSQWTGDQIRWSYSNGVPDNAAGLDEIKQ